MTSLKKPLHCSSETPEVEALLREIEACTLCRDHLPLGPRPVVNFDARAKIRLIGQAPGTRVHATGVPWNDPSGDRLRAWLEVPRERFYDPNRIAIAPMGFCYPGKGRSGDLPPRPECAPQWMPRVWEATPAVELTLLVGSYAQRYFLPESKGKTLTETVRNFDAHLPSFFPLPHPSPRNTLWLRKNPWFEAEVIPALRRRVRSLL